MIAQTSWFESTKEDVGRFVDYLDKDWTLEDDLGRDVDEASKTRFAELAERVGGKARMMTISPEDGTDLSDWEMMTSTHRTMREYSAGKYSLQYIAALHRDTDHDHVQLAMVGQDNDLAMDREDIREFREISLEQFGEQEWGLIQERLDGRTVDEVADDQVSRLSNLTQTTLPAQEQEAEQIELDDSLERLNDEDVELSMRAVSPMSALFWLDKLPFSPFWISVVGIPPVALLVFWLAHGEKVKATYDHLGPDRDIRGSVRSVAQGVVTSLREGVLSIPGVAARHVAGALADGNWVLLMDDIEHDERHTSESPIQMERNESMLFAGATKAGKSSTMRTVLHQHDFGENETVIAYDYKTEWFDYFDGRDDVNVVRVSPNPSRSTVTWNIFEELETENDAMNVADDLTKGLDGGEFFSEAGTQLLEGIMRVLIRRRIPGDDYDDAVLACRERDIPLPSNKDLVDYLQKNSPERMYMDLDAHDDLTGVSSFIHPESKKQAIGVIASMQVSVRKMFAREFGKAGSFSIREYMEDPQGTVVVLDLPEKQKDTTKPVFRMLIDRAAAHANTKKEPAMFLLDEFASLPKLENMDRLVNAGRSYNTQVLGAVQSVSQVYDTYGNDLGESILEGFTQKVLMRSEGDTRGFVQDVLGPDVKEKTVPVLNDEGERVGSDVQRVEQYPFSQREIMNWRQGDDVKAVAKTADGGWVFGTLRHPDDVCDLVDEAREHLDRRE